jgi:hypothetical protein
MQGYPIVIGRLVPSSANIRYLIPKHHLQNLKVFKLVESTGTPFREKTCFTGSRHYES